MFLFFCFKSYKLVFKGQTVAPDLNPFPISSGKFLRLLFFSFFFFLSSKVFARTGLSRIHIFFESSAGLVSVSRSDKVSFTFPSNVQVKVCLCPEMVAVIQAGFYFFSRKKRCVYMCADGKKGSWGKPVRYKFSLWVPKFFSTSKRRCPWGGCCSLARSLPLSPLLLRKPPRSVRMLSLHSVAGNKKSTYDSAQQNLERTGGKNKPNELWRMPRKPD